jgi:hypothetical protein
MSWDARGYGGHGGEATAPAYEWLFAEGSQGYFDTFLLLANSGDADANVTVRFLLEGGGVVTHALTVPPQSRRTIDAGSIAALVKRDLLGKGAVRSLGEIDQRHATAGDLADDAIGAEAVGVVVVRPLAFVLVSRASRRRHQTGDHRLELRLERGRAGIVRGLQQRLDALRRIRVARGEIAQPRRPRVARQRQRLRQQAIDLVQS